jgi:two-component system CheB/CheR fusion protein
MNAPALRGFDKTFIAGLGASAGGLEALRELLEEARPQDGVAYVVVQHLDPTHESLMAEILRRYTSLPVRQVMGGETVAAGHVYIIPPGSALRIENGVLQLENFEAPRGLRRPIDTFFRSLSLDQHENAICVVLSGTGGDGSTGLKFVKENGGLCIAQDPASAKYDGMPAAAIATGIVDYVLTPSEIAPAIVEFVRRQRGGAAAAASIDEDREDVLRTLRAAVGHDFSRYKETTLGRRIDRRLQVLGLESMSEYLALLREDADEPRRLMSELLINVTRFFRDGEAFESLRRETIAPLVANTPPGEEVRVWVPACSTGEEAYSIAMLFAAERRRQERDIAFQIFATDIDERVLDVARAGLYPPSAVEDAPEPFRRQFFLAADGQFRVSGAIREQIRFTAHNLIRDPPFSRLDLLSCRNLMIYLREDLQSEIWPIFHYALRPGGFLFLGSAEGLGGREALFSTVDQKARLFQRREGRAQFPVRMPARDAQDAPARPAPRPSPRRAPFVETHITRLIENYAPPSVVVDGDGVIVQATGKLARFLDIPVDVGGPHLLASVARPGLRSVVLSLLRAAQKDKRRAAARDLAVRSEFGLQCADVFAEPLPHGQTLVVFVASAAMNAAHADDAAEIDTQENQQRLLEEELREQRYKLRTTTEELETANEELKSSNEEMMSMNEELQSTNEELSTVNDELKVKIDQLIEANADLANFFSSTSLAVVMLDRSLHVRSFSDAASEIFSLRQRGKGAPLASVPTTLKDSAFVEKAADVLATGAAASELVASRDKIWSLYMTPYRSAEGEIGGVTLVFSDVTEQRSREYQLARERERAQLAIKIAGLGAWEYEAESGATVVDEEIKHMFGLAEVEAGAIGNFLQRIDPADRANVEAQLSQAIAGEAPYEAVFRVNHPDGRQRVIKSLGAVVGNGRPRKIVGVNFDVTSEQEAVTLREMVIREMNHRIKNMFAVIASILRGAARTAVGKQELVEVVTNRILALSNAHSLVLGAEKASVPLRTLVTTALEPYARGAGFVVEGPELLAPSDSVTSLALIFHEWATNAAKYGVLGPVAGALEVRWRPIEGSGARLTWVERYASPQAAPEPKAGFGSRLVALSCTTINAQLHQQRCENQFALSLEFAVEDGAA